MNRLYVEVEYYEVIDLLPHQLKGKVRNRRALARALKEGLIAYENEMWVSHFSSVRELAYFWGRVICMDYVVGRKLLKGRYEYPARSLEQTFGVHDMKDPRKKIAKNKIPRHYKEFDFLFDIRP